MSSPLHAMFRLFPLLSILALGGCMSMSGLGGDSKYACKAPEGVTCDSVSGTYANAVANNLPSQRKRQSPTGKAMGEATTSRPATPRAGLPAASGSSPEEVQTSLRAQARYLRLWIKPWEDIDGDLYDQAHVYVQVDQGRWQIDHIQQRIRDAYAPLRPPPSNASDGAGASASRIDPTQPVPRPAVPALVRPLNSTGEAPQ